MITPVQVVQTVGYTQPIELIYGFVVDRHLWGGLVRSSRSRHGWEGRFDASEGGKALVAIGNHSARVCKYRGKLCRSSRGTASRTGRIRAWVQTRAHQEDPVPHIARSKGRIRCTSGLPVGGMGHGHDEATVCVCPDTQSEDAIAQLTARPAHGAGTRIVGIGRVTPTGLPTRRRLRSRAQSDDTDSGRLCRASVRRMDVSRMTIMEEKSHTFRSAEGIVSLRAALLLPVPAEYCRIQAHGVPENEQAHGP